MRPLVDAGTMPYPGLVASAGKHGSCVSSLARGWFAGRLWCLGSCDRCSLFSLFAYCSLKQVAVPNFAPDSRLFFH